jgi:hypothetical protein
MAQQVSLNNPSNNLIAKSYVGFSWTAFFFGPFPLLFRSEWGFFLIFVAVYIVVGIFTFGIGGWVLGVVWAFMFNKWHLRRLLEKGYKIDETQNASLVAEAKASAGVKA